jgi:hypothetical protein
MAVLIEAYSVICRLETLQLRYVGGLSAYEASIPNQTYCKDAYLCRIGFAHSADIKQWVHMCTQSGLEISTDIAIADQVEGLWTQCSWLTIETDENGTMWAGLVGATNHQYSVPSGWKPGGVRMVDRSILQSSQSKGTQKSTSVFVPEAIYHGSEQIRPWWKFW